MRPVLFGSMRHILMETRQGYGWRSRWLRFLALATATALVLIGLYGLPARQEPQALTQRSSHHQLASLFQTQPVAAQRLRASDIAEIVYAQHPDLPLENTYIDDDSGDVDDDSTLMSRFIRYHVYVVRRFPNFRLDWKLTFADYLGANEWVLEDEYPGVINLRTNPRDQDLEAIRQLSIAQRDAVIETLVEIFTSDSSRLPGFGI
ncbi:MAG: hypothetical protein WBA57_06485 [Elainellaceae cyanobacterium]